MKKREKTQKPSALFALIGHRGMKADEAREVLATLKRHGFVPMHKRWLALMKRGISAKIGIIIKLMEMQIEQEQKRQTMLRLLAKLAGKKS